MNSSTHLLNSSRCRTSYSSLFPFCEQQHTVSETSNDYSEDASTVAGNSLMINISPTITEFPFKSRPPPPPPPPPPPTTTPTPHHTHQHSPPSTQQTPPNHHPHPPTLSPFPRNSPHTLVGIGAHADRERRVSDVRHT